MGARGDGLRRPTLAGVAAEAGVSLATVSKVLNGRDDVAPATRTLIKRLLEEHRYVPTSRRRHSAVPRTIGLVFDDFMSPYATELVRGVTDAGTELGADVVVGRFGGEAAGRTSGASWARRLVQAGRDGVLVVTSDLSSQEVAGFQQARLPLVVVDPVHTPEPPVVSIGVTNWAGGLSATAHLAELGHRRIAYVGGPGGAAIDQARLHGYHAGLTNAGLALDPALVTHGDFGFEAGRDAASTLLRLPDPPTAIFAVTDVSALGVVQAAAALGLRVPADVSVVGFDDTYVAPWSTPPLTTVSTPLREVGRVALLTLLRLVEGESIETHHVELATGLTVRGSTAPPRGDRPSGSAPQELLLPEGADGG